MSCSFPKIAYQEGYKGEYSGKLVFVPVFDFEDISLSKPQLIKKYAWYARHQDLVLNGKRFIIPCGQCTECRLQKSRETATRIILETAQYTDNWAVTLTYDDEFIKYGSQGRATLVPEDLTKFMKDLRRYFEYHYHFKGIRFYAAAEYGSKSARPHFHLILFNFPLKADDIKLCKNEKSQSGDDIFESDLISDIWSKGRVRLNVVTWQYAAYCARYMMKKQLGRNSEIYKILDIVPEFTRGSNRPGLGYKFYEENRDKILHDQSILVKIKDKAVRVPIPKYFIKKFEDDEIDVSSLKDYRMVEAENFLNKQINSYSADIFEVLRDLENQKKSKSRSLIRSLV